MGGSDAGGKAAEVPAGLSDEDPFALQWADQRPNILRGFLFVWGDDGVDHSAADLEKMSHEQLVDLCVQKQQDREKAIDKPWVVSVSESCWSGGVDEDIMAMWDVSTRDLRALEDLKVKEHELVKKRRGRSPSPRRAATKGSKAVPMAAQWEADDLIPLSLHGRGGKRADKAGESSKKGAKSSEHRAPPPPPPRSAVDKEHRKELADMRKELEQLKDARAGGEKNEGGSRD